MRIQYNKQTLMSWCYLPTRIVRFLGLAKGDDVEFEADEKTSKVEFKKIAKENK